MSPFLARLPTDWIFFAGIRGLQTDERSFCSVQIVTILTWSGNCRLFIYLFILLSLLFVSSFLALFLQGERGGGLFSFFSFVFMKEIACFRLEKWRPLHFLWKGCCNRLAPPSLLTDSGPLFVGLNASLPLWGKYGSPYPGKATAGARAVFFQTVLC